jgi:hypothetical protein
MKNIRGLIIVVVIVIASLFLMVNASMAFSETIEDHHAFLPVIFGGDSASPKLLISEVMYDVGDEPEEEWIEIYNPGDQEIDLSNYKIGDEETQGSSEGMLQFPQGHSISPGQVIVIANNAISFFGVYGFNPDFEITDSGSQVPEMIAYASWGTSNIQLSNTGDEVLLLNDSDEFVDSISWGSSAWAFDPSAKDVSDGHSLERWPVSWDTDSADDWRDQEFPDPGNVDLSVPEPTATPTPTPTPSPPPLVVINEILADPAGDLSGDANGDGIRDGADDEFVEIINTTDHAVDISGWSLGDGLRVRHVFSNGTLLQSGCGVVVFGGGEPTGTFGNCVVQIASKGSLGLNNSGDSVTLFDVRNRVIDTYTYGSEAGNNQSITRYPDIVGEFIEHSEAAGSAGALFSPGTQIDGSLFLDCIE